MALREQQQSSQRVSAAPKPGRQGLPDWNVNAHTRKPSKSGSHPGTTKVDEPEEAGESIYRPDPGIAAAPLFVYGTLMSGAVMEALLGRVPLMESALLYQHKRFPAADQVVAGMVPSEVWEDHVEQDVDGWREPIGQERGSLVVGQAVFELKMPERRLLDAFAEEEYTLVPVKPVIAEDDREVDAVTYMWRAKYIDGLDWKGDDWDYAKFQQGAIQDYIELCKEFRIEYFSGLMSDTELEELVGRKLPQGPGSHF